VAVVPAAQVKHAVLLPSLYEPGAHGVHPAAVADGTQYVLTGQQIEAPEVVHWGAPVEQAVRVQGL